MMPMTYQAKESVWITFKYHVHKNWIDTMITFFILLKSNLNIHYYCNFSPYIIRPCELRSFILLWIFTNIFDDLTIGC